MPDVLFRFAITPTTAYRISFTRIAVTTKAEALTFNQPNNVTINQPEGHRFMDRQQVSN